MATIVLTENQINYLSEIVFLNEQIGQINESFDLKQIWDKYKQAIIAGVSVVAILSSINSLNLNNNQKEWLKEKVKTEMSEEQADTTFQQKVDAVKSYMDTALKNQGYSSENLQLSPETLVKCCDEYNFDLPLLMAQAHLESCFGMTPRARKTGSVFSVGCYDNGKNVVSYTNQNDSVPSYIKLMQRDYIGDNTVDDILQSNKFVNMNGNRYAQDPNYESKVKSIRNRILKKYPILGN